MRKLGRWSVRILCGIAVLTVLYFGAVYALFSPEGGLRGTIHAGAFIAHWFFHPLIDNRRPPPLVRGFYEPWRAENEATREQLQALMKRNFPEGTTEAVLRKTLKAQGFKPVRDHSVKALEYVWGGLNCQQVITVSWTADAEGKLSHTDIAHGVRCMTTSP